MRNLITVREFRRLHPEIQDDDQANNSLNWGDVSNYLVKPSDVRVDDFDAKKYYWSEYFYYRPTPKTRSYKEGVAIGMELAQVADEVEEVEPGLYQLWFD